MNEYFWFSLLTPYSRHSCAASGSARLGPSLNRVQREQNWLQWSERSFPFPHKAIAAAPAAPAKQCRDNPLAEADKTRQKDVKRKERTANRRQEMALRLSEPSAHGKTCWWPPFPFLLSHKIEQDHIQEPSISKAREFNKNKQTNQTKKTTKRTNQKEEPCLGRIRCKNNRGQI